MNKEDAWKFWREAWNIRGAKSTLEPIDQAAARSAFEDYWSKNHENND